MSVAAESHPGKPRHPVSDFRRRAWIEHPLAIPANISWAVLIVVVLVLIPIRQAPASLWAVAIAWAVINAALVAYVRSTLTVRRPVVDWNAPVIGASLFRDAMRRLRRNQVATLSVGLLVLLIFLCFGQKFAFDSLKAQSSDPESFFALHLDHTRINKAESFTPPSVRHWFGTDALGRDLFARTLYGGHISFVVALVATTVSLVIGVSWGAIAGYFGGKIDHFLMRIVDILYGLPFLFLVILILTLVNGLHATAGKNRDFVRRYDELRSEGKNAEADQELAAKEVQPGEVAGLRWAIFLDDSVKPIYAMFFALGMVSWLTMARITRGQVLSLRERDFVLAARTIGAGHLRIIFRHIVPNLLGPVIVYTTLTIPSVMLSEAFLSFLGLGIAEPECSWGSLASEGIAAINVLKPSWWLLAYPAGAISIALFALNFIGDGLRDALDPRSK